MKKTTGKKACALLAALLLILATLCAAAEESSLRVVAEAVPAAGDLAREEARAIAMEVLAQRPDVAAPAGGDLYDFPLYAIEARRLSCRETFVMLADGGGAWVVSFAPEDLPVFAGAVTIASPGGEVLEAVLGEEAPLMARWEAERGPRWFWSQEDRVLYDQLYVSTSMSVSVLPQEGDLPREEALAIAKAALERECGVPSETLDAEYRLDMELCLLSLRGAEKERVWCVDFRRLDPASGNWELCYSAQVMAEDGAVYHAGDNGGNG